MVDRWVRLAVVVAALQEIWSWLGPSIALLVERL
jgi:hypothetical protein